MLTACRLTVIGEMLSACAISLLLNRSARREHLQFLLGERLNERRLRLGPGLLDYTSI